MFRSNENYRYVEAISKVIGLAIDVFLLILGPILICVVASIVLGELYAFFVVLLPIHCSPWSVAWSFNACFALFLGINISWNYIMCVSTNPGTHDSDIYQQLLHDATESGDLNGGSRRREGLGRVDATDLRVQRRGVPGAEPGKEMVPQPISWVDQEPFEWGYCRRTKIRKAPRAHYDHITKKLVLNMDHYCPWMFNVVGYMNYRYFVNFLLYVLVACIYGIFLTTGPFMEIVRREKARGRSIQLGNTFTPTSATTYTFVLALSISIAVGLLFFWHLYLIMTAQTTIEFYGNQTMAYRARVRGLRYQNPYDLGSKRSNWAQVYGSGHPALSILPSTRKPPLPPWPSRFSSVCVDLQGEHVV